MEGFFKQVKRCTHMQLFNRQWTTCFSLPKNPWYILLPQIVPKAHGHLVLLEQVNTWQKVSASSYQREVLMPCFFNRGNKKSSTSTEIGKNLV